MKYPTKSTYGLKYFRNIVIILTNGQHTKIQLGKKHLFLLPCCPPPPSLSGWGGGGWVVSTPLPPNFFHCNLFLIRDSLSYARGLSTVERIQWMFIVNQVNVYWKVHIFCQFTFVCQSKKIVPTMPQVDLHFGSWQAAIQGLEGNTSNS